MQSYRRIPTGQNPSDAVVVTLWQRADQTFADVACAACPDANDSLAAQHPRSVASALKRAEELRFVYGLRDVVVALPTPSLWRSEWGNLAN